MGSFLFQVGRSSVSRIVREGCTAIWNALNETYLTHPRTEAEWKAIADEYFQEWNLPHVIGALDGKHINIQCPKLGGSDFRNYKGFYSTNLMATCDAKYRFIFVDVGSYGRDNDAAVFNRTNLYQLLESGDAKIPPQSPVNGFDLPYVLIGDEIFPLKNWLMKPYPGSNLSESQRIYNYRLSRARRCIENAFGILSARWQIFRRPICANLDLIDNIVQACCCLHNYLLSTDNAKYLPTGFADSYDSSGQLIHGGWRAGISNQAFASLRNQGSNFSGVNPKTVRDRFCLYVNSHEGSLPWQVEYIRDSGRVAV